MHCSYVHYSRGLKIPVAQRFGSIRKILGHGPVLKICPDCPKYVRTVKISPESSRCVWIVQNLSRQLKICLDSLNCPKYVSSICVQTVKDVSSQLKLCPDSPKSVRTVQNLSRQLKICPNSPKCVQTVQDMSGQLKICPNCSKFVRLAQNMSEQPKICLEMHYIFLRDAFTYFFGRSQVMITHFLGMSRKIFTRFSSGRFLGATRKILGFKVSGHNNPCKY